MCMGIHAIDCKWKSEAKSVELVLSLYLDLGSVVQTGVIRLTGKAP